MTRTRVVVTGTGAISALGTGVPANLAGLYAGRVQPPGLGIPPTNLKHPPPVFAVDAAIDDVVARDGRDLTRTSRLALVALQEAASAAWGGGSAPALPARIGVCMGTTVGCTFNNEPAWDAWRVDGHVDRANAERVRLNDLAVLLAAEVGARGPRLTVANACASGTDAVGVGLAWLRSGRCDLVIAGGADELSRFAYLGFSAMNLSPERCRPFDVARAGLNLGEGAGILVLEREADARARGAAVLGFVEGYGSAGDAYHPTAPHPDGRGLRAALAAAFADAGIDPAAVGFVNAHGTATIENDRVEGRVLRDVLPGASVVSTKGVTGHTLGAAGALEAIFTLHHLRDGRAPPCAGCTSPDPECGVVPALAAALLDTPLALSDSLGFGGANAALVLGRGAP